MPPMAAEKIGLVAAGRCATMQPGLDQRASNTRFASQMFQLI